MVDQAAPEAPADKGDVEGARAESRTMLAIAELKRKGAQPKPDPLPISVAVSDIRMLPEVFQPRGPNGTNEAHIQELKRSLSTTGELEPVLVAWFGPEPYLIDGHHRIYAYQQARWSAPIAIRHFGGSVEEAVLEAGRANTRAKLPMNHAERMSYAWRLVLMGTAYSKKRIVEVSNISDGQVAVMRRVAKKLGAEAFDYQEWWQAQRAWKGKGAQILDDEERASMLEALAEDYAARLAKEFSAKLVRNPEVAAMAFARHFGRNLPELVEQLQGYVDEVVPNEGNPDF